MQLKQRLMRLLRWRRTGAPHRISLALQGGGSHGAFTWGVLDRLLEDERIELAAISGTSAGALNAGVLATGYARGGRAQARQALAAFWGDVSRAGAAFAPYSAGAGNPSSGEFNLDHLPAYQWASSFFRAFSPYVFNPLGVNPLREVACRHVDENALRSGPIALFVTATSVRSGQPRVFQDTALSIDALLASACLPFLFRAVEIDGEAYWDGGYTGNPALFPLIHRTTERDLVLVKINPSTREELPTRGVEIVDRVSEISFNASLIAELRAIAFVARLLREHRLNPARHKALRMHMIADDAGLAPYNSSSKLNTELAFLETLHALGRNAASNFLLQHFDDLGERSSLDIEKSFLGKA